jgi:hypothetical protein
MREPGFTTNSQCNCMPVRELPFLGEIITLKCMANGMTEI